MISLDDLVDEELVDCRRHTPLRIRAAALVARHLLRRRRLSGSTADRANQVVDEDLVEARRLFAARIMSREVSKWRRLPDEVRGWCHVVLLGDVELDELEDRRRRSTVLQTERA